MHIMARQVKTYEPLEQNRPCWERGSEKDKQAGCGAAIGDHIKDSAKLCRLLEIARGDAIKGVEKARDAVQERASSWVKRHIVEGCDGEDNAGIA